MGAPQIEAAKDAAQAMVTCVVHGDRAGAVAILDAYGREHGTPEVLALVLVDLAHYVHLSWFHVACKAAGAPAPLAGTELAAASADQWRGILLDVECRRAVA